MNQCLSAEVLAKYQVIYLGVLEPLASTKCLSRYGTSLAQRSRVCAKAWGDDPEC